MRFATYGHNGRQSSGIVGEDGTLHPLRESLTELVRAGADLGTAPREASPGPHVTEVRLLPPLEPRSIRDFVTFEEHVEGVRRSVDGSGGVPEAWYAAPTFYFTNPHSVLGAHDEVPVPPGCAAFDFELEVAAVVGRTGTDLTAEQAREHILGYTIFNDFSARDLQSAEMKVGLGPCKGKDSASTLGPYLVTADELEPHRDDEGFLRLRLTAELNGEVVGSDLLSNMSWTFEEMLGYASRGTRVLPGDLLGSGTCGNGGCLAELWGRHGRGEPPPLRPGDEVTLTAEGIGSVSNTVVPGVPVKPLPRARKRSRARR
ncbi:fumarylacetoacetate hydrolase family protein [Saccharopolyspora sp. HNM0986]|uniref:fumarylacetoacetate hydrolase family protein n=1 Tax=Saccharopolyspora galaxeae TaxID=2781241 RepID=UPI00190B83E4|nr:fumarylacetoacetate hydrolase family protein [Saccharopolyspora sp. HNM0986]MBK0867884.1 fumarylacetoacetate hydrolase family protein [Saccharopolyspora sp. HNM0986]